jgi:hypothetical protein
MVRLSEKDWSEIYYALEHRWHLLRGGGFGAEMECGQNQRWTKHLTRIMNTIGPDGSAAAGQGTSSASSTLRRSESHSPSR